MFDVDTLRLLVTVADTGSFTQAATALNYTQPAVSRRIAALEKQAGGPLFERLPRGVRLGPAGQVLYQHAVDVLERLSQAARDLAAVHAGHGGTLRVGAFSTANVSLVPAALRALRQARPQIDIVAVEGRSALLMQRLADGELDLAVVSDYPCGLASVDGVTTDVLLEDDLLVVLPREHRLASAEVIDLGDLREETWLQDAPAGGHPTRLTDACARAGFQPRKIIRIAEWTGKFGHVAAGLGVALVPSLAAWAVPADLVLRRLDDPALRRTVHIALPAGPLSAGPLPAALTLRDLLRDAPSLRPSS
ncbi:LysR family transcriptional regulator [Frankia sp. R82]|uniref:LysR family transcriptional regulator n=1 Tax=Frankia sp. R82 TaxID=2950553 RepID=UPI00204355B4|nr:LysR substrate-binding domain-containing protein [Frankia sp. R82]MCM3886641.1 LysR substrate-binding domain-containing protein [Frankia sp. R82]